MVRRGHSVVKIDSLHHTRISTSLLGGDDDYPIVEIHGDVRGEQSSRRIGYLHGYVMCARWLRHDLEGLFRICDRHDQDLCDVVGAMLEAKFPLRRRCPGELFYFQAIELHPKSQGIGLGAKVISSLFTWLRRFHDVSSVIMLPSPPQFAHPFHYTLADEATASAYQHALDRLCHYYRSQFEAEPLCDGSPYYFAPT